MFCISFWMKERSHIGVAAAFFQVKVILNRWGGISPQLGFKQVKLGVFSSSLRRGV